MRGKERSVNSSKDHRAEKGKRAQFVMGNGRRDSGTWPQKGGWGRWGKGKRTKRAPPQPTKNQESMLSPLGGLLQELGSRNL